MRLIILMAAVVCPLFAATEWLKVTSSNFEMYSTADDKDARRTLEYFEQVRDFFMRVKSQQVTTRLPVTLVVFKNQKEYRPYSPHETAAAYYMGDEHRDYIVMGGAGQEQYPVAVHEYMHLLVRHSGLKMPVWLNEGMAEVYSTLKPLGGTILVGTPPQNRAYPLSQQKWIPIDRLLAVAHDSPEYNEKNRTGLFYAESWLLTHMLMLDNKYGNQFGKFVIDLSNAGSAEGAFQRVYAKTPADVDKDLQSYFRANSVQGVLFPTKLEKIQVNDPRPATAFETDLTLAKLTALLRRRPEAEKRYSELAKANPNSWEVYEGLAHLRWQEGDLAGARENLKRAVGHKPKNWEPYWDYARLAQNDPSVVEALQSALQLNPQLSDARMMLGFELYRAHRYKEAYDTLSQIRQVTPERAASFFLVRAYSALQIGETAEAKSSAEVGKKHAKSPVEIAQAESILEAIERPLKTQADAKTAAPSLNNPPSFSNPMIRSEAMKPEEDFSVVRGTLEQIECLGKEARLSVLSGAVRLSLLIRDPDRVLLKNSDQSAVNFTCGPQKDTRVIVEYREREDTQFKTTGDIATLEFTTRKAQ